MQIKLGPAPGSKKGWSVVTTVAGFFTSSTCTAKDLASNIASSLTDVCAHLSSRFFKLSDMNFLLLEFFLVGFGDSSGCFFLPAGVDSVFLPTASPSTHPNTLTYEGSTRLGVTHKGEAEPSSALFPPSSVCGGGQLLKLFWGKSSANGAVLQNTRVVTHPIVSASCALKMAIKHSHTMATSASLLSWG